MSRNAALRSPAQMLLATVAAALTLAAGLPATASHAPPPTRGIAIVGVDVVPMDRERILRDQTVIVRGERVERVGPVAEVRVPDDVRVIDGRGRYLMPGLVDVHVHLAPGAGDRGDPAWRQMSLLVANGVTTARSLSGSPAGLHLRERVRAGELVGPRLSLAGPSLNQQSTPTPASARRAVREQKSAGFDFLKTHGVGLDTYEAIVEEAAGAKIRLVGHVTPDYGLERALAAGQQIEHLDGYLAALVPDGGSVPVPPGQVHLGEELAHMDASRMPALARATVQAGVWNSPTLALFEVVASGRDPSAYTSWPEVRYASREAVDAWSGHLREMAAAPIPAQNRTRFLDLRRAMTRALHDAGAGLMAGSDSPQFFLVPGFALHRELDALARAGLSPFEVLRTATRNPGEYLGGEPSFGQVAEGMAADLLLLDANPLEDVRHARTPAGVVLRGRWLPRESLAALLEQVAAASAC